MGNGRHLTSAVGFLHCLLFTAPTGVITKLDITTSVNIKGFLCHMLSNKVASTCYKKNYYMLCDVLFVFVRPVFGQFSFSALYRLALQHSVWEQPVRGN